MCNLNGYEINGRSLRVDFADGDDKSGGADRKRHDTGGHTRLGGASSGNFRSGAVDGGPPAMVTGKMAIHAIESAIARLGLVKLYDMLEETKARGHKEYFDGKPSAHACNRAKLQDTINFYSVVNRGPTSVIGPFSHAGRDPRLSKRSYPAEQGLMLTLDDNDASKHVKPSGAGDDVAPPGHFDAIAEIARDMTPPQSWTCCHQTSGKCCWLSCSRTTFSF